MKKITILIEDEGKQRELEIELGSHLFTGQTGSDGKFLDWSFDLTDDERRECMRAFAEVNRFIQREDSRV